MSSQLEGEPIDIYEMRITYAIHSETGETMVGFHEQGERVDLITQLGMLDLTRDTVLQTQYEDETDDD